MNFLVLMLLMMIYHKTHQDVSRKHRYAGLLFMGVASIVVTWILGR